jgi:hypothetical protein
LTGVLPFILSESFDSLARFQFSLKVHDVFNLFAVSI